MQAEINVQDYLKKEVSESKTLLKEMKKRPTKDLNHKLRVSIRRIRTIIQLLQKDGKAPLPKKENKILKKMWQHLGEVRDFDVSEEIAQKHELPLQRIRRERKDIDGKLQKDLTKANLKKLLNHLQELSADKALKHVHPAPVISTIRDRINALSTENDNMHAFRIVLKKVRYLMEAMNIEDEEFKKYQDVLGKLNDLKVFLDCQGESANVRGAYRRQLNKAHTILDPAKKLALKSLNKAERLSKKTLH